MVTYFRYSKLSPEQIDWLNKYNEQVVADVAPRWLEWNYLIVQYLSFQAVVISRHVVHT